MGLVNGENFWPEVKRIYPVKIYKIFVSHRPPLFHDQSPFFLGLRYRLDFKSEIVWYFI